MYFEKFMIFSTFQKKLFGICRKSNFSCLLVKLVVPFKCINNINQQSAEFISKSYDFKTFLKQIFGTVWNRKFTIYQQ